MNSACVLGAGADIPAFVYDTGVACVPVPRFLPGQKSLDEIS
jgi:hypothetical protein